MAPQGWGWGQSNTGATLTMMAQHPPHFNSINTSSANKPIVQRRPSQLTFDTPQWEPHSHFPASRSSRKRSRDDVGWDEDDESSRSSTAPFPSSHPTPSPPKHGPGMGSLLNSSNEGGQTMEGVSQTGAWAEELSERLRSSDLTREDVVGRPRLEARKSLRLDRSDAMEDATLSVSLNNQVRTTEEPVIDEATRTLGMSWTSIVSSPTMDAASRGWARHIETNFPLQSVKIVWQNSSLPAYLVSAVTCDGRQRGGSPNDGSNSRSMSPWHRPVGSPGYFLFDEGLTQGRLIAKSWGQTLEHLRASPMVFEGEKVMDADADEAQRFSETTNWQHWAGWRSDWKPKKDSSPPPAPSVEVTGDGMDMG